jgi:chromosome segregation ATPase
VRCALRCVPCGGWVCIAVCRFEALCVDLKRVVDVRESQMEKGQVKSAALFQELNEAKAELTALKTALDTERTAAAAVKDERDRLRRARDSAEASESLVRAKDEQIAAVLKEGEGLSRRQSELEMTIRKLRKDIADRDKAIEKAKSDVGTDAQHTTGTRSLCVGCSSAHRCARCRCCCCSAVCVLCCDGAVRCAVQRSGTVLYCN